jgi:hypothetical protein
VVEGVPVTGCPVPTALGRNEVFSSARFDVLPIHTGAYQGVNPRGLTWCGLNVEFDLLIDPGLVSAG